MPIKIADNQGIIKDIKFPIINNRLPSKVLDWKEDSYTSNYDVNNSFWSPLTDNHTSLTIELYGVRTILPADRKNIYVRFDDNHYEKLSNIGEGFSITSKNCSGLRNFYQGRYSSFDKIIYQFNNQDYELTNADNNVKVVSNSENYYLFTKHPASLVKVQDLTKYTLNYNNPTNVLYQIQAFEATQGHPVAVDFFGVGQGVYTTQTNNFLGPTGRVEIEAGEHYVTMYSEAANTAFYGLNGARYSNFGSYLTDIKFGDEVNRIGDFAYKGCSGLTGVSIPSGPTGFIIGQNAFENSGLSGVLNIPSNVSEIDQRAFKNCTGITSITGMMGPTGIANSLFEGCSNLTSFTIPSNIQWIGNSSFKDSGLIGINIPNTVANIGQSGFAGCSAMTSITIPFVGGSTGSNQFFGYIFGATGFEYQNNYIPTNLKNVVISNGIIPDYAFFGCTGIEAQNTNSFGNITHIGTDAFYECTSITHLDLPYLKSANIVPFQGLYNLESIKIGSTGAYFEGENAGLISDLIKHSLEDTPQGVDTINITASKLGSNVIHLATTVPPPKLYSDLGTHCYFILKSLNYYKFNNNLINPEDDIPKLIDYYDKGIKNFKITLGPGDGNGELIIGNGFLGHIWDGFFDKWGDQSYTATYNFFRLLQVGPIVSEGIFEANDWFEDIMMPGGEPGTYTYSSCWVMKRGNNLYDYYQGQVIDEFGRPQQNIGEYNSAFLQYLYTISIMGGQDPASGLYAIYDKSCSNLNDFKSKYRSIFPY